MKRSEIEIVGVGASQRGSKAWSSLTVMTAGFLITLVILLLFILPTSISPDIKQNIGNEQYPLIVLLHGKPPNAPYEWNTGVWTAWGVHSGDLYKREIKQELRWQAEGAVITKTCDVHCLVTHDQSLVPHADAVIMELVNHYKFYGKDTNLPIPWPEKSSSKKQYVGLFQYESHKEYAFMSDSEEIMSHFDFTMTPSQDSDLQVTLMCDWGYTPAYFKLPPPIKERYPRGPGTPKVMVADFRGVIPNEDPVYRRYFEELNGLIEIDYFAGPFKNADAPGPYTLKQRISHMGKYVFIIVAESIFEKDWICPELSQALLSGAVPIYFGAENIEEYLPSPTAIINGRKMTAQQVADKVNEKAENYNLHEFNDWKFEPLIPSFVAHLEHCAHVSECRICKKVIELNDQK